MFGDEPVIDLEGIIHFETLLLARAIDWLATLSIDPDSEVRRGTLSVFSELKAAYSAQSSLHELYFHQYDGYVGRWGATQTSVSRPFV